MKPLAASTGCMAIFEKDIQVFFTGNFSIFQGHFLLFFKRQF